MKLLRVCTDPAHLASDHATRVRGVGEGQADPVPQTLTRERVWPVPVIHRDRRLGSIARFDRLGTIRRRRTYGDEEHRSTRTTR